MPDRSQERLGSAAPAVVAGVIGLAVTLVVLLTPGLHFAYRSRPGHLALENLDAAVAAVVTVLFFGRYRRGGQLRDLLVSWAFALLASCGFLLVLVPIVSSDPSVVVTAWIPLVLRLFGAWLIAFAAAVPARQAIRPDRVRWLVLATVAILVASVIVGVTVDKGLSQPLNPDVSPETSGRPLLTGNAIVLLAQAMHAVLYGYAAYAFALEGRRTNDHLTRWLSVGCAFAAFARVNYFLFPSLYSQWLYSGDFLRTAFYLALGVGAVRELRTYLALQADHAVFAERRRLARDLHDGTVQELGYIRGLARRAGKTPLDPDTAEKIASAAERAIAEARQAIAALTLPLDEPLVDVVRRAAGEIGDRYDVDVEVVADGSVEVGRDQRETIVRIVREAVSNAARHADPRHIGIRMGAGWLEVQDDGKGFDVEEVPAGGFGLVSIRERAESIGGEVQVRSLVGAGTTVRVVWNGRGH